MAFLQRILNFKRILNYYKLVLTVFLTDDHPIMRPGWFSSLFDFIETDYKTAQSGLEVVQNETGQNILVSRVSGKRFLVGKFSTPTLSDLRKAATESEGVSKLKQADSVLTLNFVYGDVSVLHADETFRYATFQAASQFNCLEFVNPDITPEHGISIYVCDRTQGPACSIACGAATAYRNYFHTWTNARGEEMVSATNPPFCLAPVPFLTCPC
jgi:hypothetical protein